jgi:excinuclease UvrABC nuclease subunit
MVSKHGVQQLARRSFTKRGISSLPANKPVVYELETGSGNPNYIGRAKRGRVRQRLSQHLPGGSDPIPAKTVKIRQFPSIADAKAAEKRAIRAKQPKYNKQHKS